MTSEEAQPDNLVSFRPRVDEQALATPRRMPARTDLGLLLETVERMNQQLHVLDRAFAALVGFATPEQKFAVARLVSTAGDSYKPAVVQTPEPEGYVLPQIADTVAIYTKLLNS